MRERELIAAIEERLGARGGRVLRGPGDDAAVVAAEPVLVSSTDTVVEGVHFQLATHSYADVGHKALATALSDLAAMGASAGEAYAALVLPECTESGEAMALVDGMETLAADVGVAIAGGDVTSGPALVVTASVNGWARSRSELVCRDGARPNQLVGVTGELGGSEAGLLLLQGAEANATAAERTALIARHLRPTPLLELGRSLAGAGAAAMIDISDGIATDAAHVAEQSGVAIRIDLGRLPLAPGMVAVAETSGGDPAELAAVGGEDFELLLCAGENTRDAVERAAAANGRPVTWIGETGEGEGLELRHEDGSLADLRGYEHRTGS